LTATAALVSLTASNSARPGSRAIKKGAIVSAIVALCGIAAPVAHGLGAGGIKGNIGAWDDPILSANGRYLAFSSFATNLHPDRLDLGSGRDVFVRDLDTGVVTLVSRANGPAGAKSNGNSFDPSISADGRYVAFVSSATNLPNAAGFTVYLRDLQANTTTGIAGGFAPSVSADGRFVAFSSFGALTPDDTDAQPLSDSYVWDRQTNDFELVSRATGSPGVKGNGESFDTSISSDGRYVAFESVASNFDPADSDTGRDIYVRDRQSNTTTLASRASGVAGGNGTSDALDPKISANGSVVAFQTLSSLSPEDTDTYSDIYARNVPSATTEIVSRASGVGGAKANGDSFEATISADGRYVGFMSDASNLSPDDPDTRRDAYARDLQTQTTTLISRASGAAGAKANDFAGRPALSSDGTFAAFPTHATNLSADDPDFELDLYVRDTTTFDTSLEHRATPGYMRYVRPRGATPFRMSLVPAYAQCTAPNMAHGAPLSFSSCSPPARLSNLNLGGNDVDLPARSIGSFLMKAIVGPEFPPDDSDVSIAFSLTNVMRPDLSDYTGELQGRIAVRITDRKNGPSSNEEGTVSDFDLAFTVPCVATTSTLTGGSCTLSTTADAVLPGFAPEGGRTVYGLGQARVYDGGADEDGGTTGDNALLAVQGVFVP
jgi:Tol biopolymer transport system component